MKRFIVKLIIFCVLLYLAQSFIVNIFSQSIPGVIAKFQNKYEDKADIVYFGESTIYTTNANDKDKSSTDIFLQRLLPNNIVGPMVNAAFQADVYAEYAEYLSKTKNPPSYIITPINMRSFSPLWDMRPQYQFEEEKLYSRYAKTYLYPFYSFMLNSGFLNLYPVSEENFYSTPVFAGKKQIGSVKDFFGNDTYKQYSDEHMKNMIMADYMYSLSPNHRKIQSLKKITDIFASKKTKIIFYFTPIDYQTGETFLGKDFINSLNKNIEIVKKSIPKNNVIILDLSKALATDEFTWKQDIYMNEHLAESGRRFVAQELAKVIKK